MFLLFSSNVEKAGDDAAKLIRDVQGRISRPLGQLGNVAREVAGSTTSPTDAQLIQFRSASDSLKQALPQFADLEKLVPEFNSKLDQAGIPAPKAGVPFATPHFSDSAPAEGNAVDNHRGDLGA